MVSKEVINELREKGLLKEDENAVQVGDKIFAEHAVTGVRRLVVDRAVAPVSETRQLLKG